MVQFPYRPALDSLVDEPSHQLIPGDPQVFLFNKQRIEPVIRARLPNGRLTHIATSMKEYQLRTLM